MSDVQQVEISLTVNGQPIHERVRSDLTLLQFLRGQLGLTGTKEGCRQGECGACTVLVDGKPVNSCILPLLAVSGRAVETIEGLAQDHQLDVLQKAFVDEGGVQCGFCTPGMIMAAKGLLLANPAPSEEEIRDGLSGNICRCTGYQKIVRAVQVASGQAAPVEVTPREGHSVIGRKVARRDAPDKVTGRAVYADDLRMPGMLFAKALRSTYAHALILGIDCTQARQVPGVIAILTAADVPGHNRYGVAVADQPALADDKVRCTGDAVALVVAETEEAARAALPLIEVEYKKLPGVFSVQDGLAPDAPCVHGETNLFQHTKVRKGNVDDGFAQAAEVVQGEFRTVPIEHAYLEPECSVAAMDHAGNLTVWTSTQYVFRDRRQIASVLALPANSVRVIQTVTGGGFGGKDDITTEILASLAALKTARPVKVRFDRSESMRTTTKRHAVLIRARLGADRDGRLLALQAEVYADKGAYASLGGYVIKKCGLHLSGPYYVPNIKADTYAVYTNNPPGGAMRGFGVPQAAFAHESLMDMLAERLGLDPWEIRYRNALAPGLSTGTGHVLHTSVGIKATLSEVRNYLEAHPLPSLEQTEVGAR
jgi:xanthine dehydrogenase molybdenum-binding subunit